MYNSLDTFISLAPCPPATADGYKLFWSLVRNVSLTQSELSSITTRCGIKAVNNDSYLGAITIIAICVIVLIVLALFLCVGIYLWCRRHTYEVQTSDHCKPLAMNGNDLNGTELRRRTPYEHDNLAYSNASRTASMDTRYQTADSILSNHHTGYNSFDGDSIKVEQKNHSNMK
ncbi:hypothetical protein CHS0354_042683 [Potamilus streckersoni]|uniref:Uncharacterized protein n=1 Tax=Potamilus streckersoni TaxID=2493646 RepID=A0AAE0S9H6_9BIVA|nr:hypothetical protein CHS0354_042683 [Potamilus streckersoni]